MGIDWDSISYFQWLTALLALYATVLSTVVFFARRHDRKQDREERLSLRLRLELIGPPPRTEFTLILCVINDSLFPVFLDYVRFDRPALLPQASSPTEQMRDFDWKVEPEWKTSDRPTDMPNNKIDSKDEAEFRFRWAPGSPEVVRSIPDRVLAFTARTKCGTSAVLKSEQIKARAIEGLEL